jgi:hypothetical protein
MILYILLEQCSFYASFEKMRVSGNTKKDEHNVCKAVMEGISPGWKISFQNTGNIFQYECNKTTFSSLQCDTTHCKHTMNDIMWAV